MCNKSIELTATQSGAQETKDVLSGVDVKTSKVLVGSAPYEKQIPDDSVDVIVGVFFDGTQNNRDNTNARIAYETAEKLVSIHQEQSPIIDGKMPFFGHTWNKTQHPHNIKLSPQAKKYKEVLATMEDKKEQKDKMGSYENDLSNIARMEPAYPETSTKKIIQTKVYIEGIATFNYGTDDEDGMGFGTGAAGITKKVEKACIDIGIQVGKLLKKK